MKKFIAILLCSLLICFLAGCDFELEDTSSVSSETESIVSLTDSSFEKNSKESTVVSSNINSSSDKVESTFISSETTSSSKTTVSSSSEIKTPIQSSEIKESSSSEPKEQSVYVTPTGKRYHLDPDCGGKNSSRTTLTSAKHMGLTPCKKCAQ